MNTEMNNAAGLSKHASGNFMADGDLTINTESVMVHKNAMSAERKAKMARNCDSLVKLLEETLATSKNACSANWKSANEVCLSGVSPQTLHKFLLKAEELGKDVVYTKQISIKISDRAS